MRVEKRSDEGAMEGGKTSEREETPERVESPPRELRARGWLGEARR